MISSDRLVGILAPVLLVFVVLLLYSLSWDQPSINQPGIRLGSWVPGFFARDIHGVDVAVDLTGGLPTVLYVLSPACSWCDRNYDNIVALATMLSDRFRFLGLTDSERYDAALVESYLQEYPLPFDTLLVESSRFDLDLSVTPQTVVVRPDGEVQHVWIGALFGRRLSYAEYVFNVRLPGLSASEDDNDQGCWSDYGVTGEGNVVRVDGVLSVCRGEEWIPLSLSVPR